MKVRPNLTDVVRYTSVHDPDLTKIRLNSAERNIPLPNRLFNEWLDSMLESDVRYYPDVERAINKIASFEKVSQNTITIGHGSDSIIKNIFECYTGPVVTTTPAFPMYNVYSKIFDIPITEVPYGLDYKFPIEEFIDSITPDTSIVIFSNPNSPLGDTVSSHDILRIIAKSNDCNAIVVIDEAYIEFFVDQTQDIGSEPDRIYLYNFEQNTALIDYFLDQSVSCLLYTSDAADE